MANASEIIVDAGIIGGIAITVISAVFLFLKKSPPRTSGGGHTRRARRANNGTRRS